MACDSRRDLGLHSNLDGAPRGTKELSDVFVLEVDSASGTGPADEVVDVAMMERDSI